MRLKYRCGALVLLAAMVGAVAPVLAADSPQTMYSRALTRERMLRNAERKPTLTELRALIRAYEGIVGRHPASAYSDNALWQAGNVALLAYERFGQGDDKRVGIRLLIQLKRQYPSSSLVRQVDEAVRQFDSIRMVRSQPAVSPEAPAATSAVGPTALSSPSAALLAATPASDAPPPAVPTVPEPATVIALRDIRRTSLPDGVRVTLELDGESNYRSERLEHPRRVFFDLKGVRPVRPLQDATLKFTDDVVREIRLGRHPQNTTRVVLDMERVDTYSVFTLYNPFRLVIDFPRSATAAVATAPTGTAGVDRSPPTAINVPPSASAPPSPPTVEVDPTPPTTLPAMSSVPPPSLPATNSDGKFSLARQLGLSVSRIVIDAGHGGHDPGARANGINEAELVLDVAIRLRGLLQKQTGTEVVMTRDRDVYVPLEERTAIANRVGADLFLSIHANASRTSRAHGVETYFLNFATNPEAEAVAARENAASGRTMRNLPEIVRAIALNNKIDESRDFAGMVQKAMVRGLSARNRQLKDLGVKQAPFVVLIGAGMPSVLAEISFITHKQEAQLLKTPAYRQQIAEALFDAVVRYRQSLKNMKAIASR